MKKFIIIFLIINILTIILIADDSISQNDIISEDLRYHLNTQEVILERIIKHYDQNKIINHYNVASYYIEGFGALFEVQRFPTSEINLFNQFGAVDNKSKTKYVWSEEKNAIVKYKSKHSKEDSIQVIKMVDEYVKDIHLAVFEFFADYMSKENWLKEKDKVYVHFDLNLYRKIPKEYDRTMVENIIPLSFQAHVNKKDLDLFHSGKLEMEEFDKKIILNKILYKSQPYNYNILGDIIESSVRSIKEGGERPFSLHTTSISISELGVLYFVVAQHHSKNSFNNISSIFDFLFNSNSEDDEKKSESDPFTKSISELKFRLTKSVGQYGHTLKELNENQWIVLLVNIGRYGSFESRFVMKFQKKFIDQLESEKISISEFEDYMEIYEEELYLK